MITDKLKKNDSLAMATAVMTTLCAVAMVVPDFIAWLNGDGCTQFFSMLVLFAPVLIFGFVAGHRKNRKRKNGLFFVKVAAVSQLVISLFVIFLVKLVQIQDDYDNGSNWLAYLWMVSAVVTIIMYLRRRKNEHSGDDEENLKIMDHVWAVVPLAIFVILFLTNIIITAKSLHLFFNNIPR